MLIIIAIAYLYVGLSHYLLAVILDDRKDGPVPASLVAIWPVCVPALLWFLRQEVAAAGQSAMFRSFLSWLFFGRRP